MVELKTPREISQMREAGRIVAGLLEHLAGAGEPGVTTKALDEKAAAFIRQQGAAPAFLGYRGFPATICVSINEEIVHGIPGERKIREGDVVSIDAGAILHGFYADAATTVLVGASPRMTQQLVQTTRQALADGIAQAVVGNRLSDISHAVQQRLEQGGLGVVREFVGHGIGRALHEEPPVPNFGPPHLGPRLKAGMVLAIEPMATLGGYGLEILQDGWTAVTKDRSLAAHFEHTVAILNEGPSILTTLA